MEEQHCESQTTKGRLDQKGQDTARRTCVADEERAGCCVGTENLQEFGGDGDGDKDGTVQSSSFVGGSHEQLDEIWDALMKKLEMKARSQQQGRRREGTGDASGLENGQQHENCPASSKTGHLNNDRSWPSYDAVMNDVLAADYNEILTCPVDMVQNKEGKTLCPHGVVCRARLELFQQPQEANSSATAGYTGVLTPGATWEHCLLRLSSAMQPPNQAIKSTWARGIMYTTAGNKVRNAKLYPCCALKVFTTPGNKCDEQNCSHSRNILFGGSKVGQRETDFFAHCQCTSMTERMPSVVKPFVKKFWEYSKWPLSLGISDFCKPLPHDQLKNDVEDTQEERAINFPFALIIKPRIHSEPYSQARAGDDATKNDDSYDEEDHDDGDDRKPGGDKDTNESVTTAVSENSGSNSKHSRWMGWTKNLSRLVNTTSSSLNSFDSSSDKSKQSSKENSFDSFLDFALNDITPQTHLFDIYACPTPQDVADASKLQRIGKIVSTSNFIESTPDDGLFFKHQAKEEDYALRPDWPEVLSESVTVDEGKVKGTIGTLAGWKLFEQQIAKNEYIDFEQK